MAHTLAASSYQTALYLRLSKDDEGSGESASITSQRSMLLAYAKAHGYTVFAEYVDDGYPGTSFDRPAFKRMLRDIEAGKISLILTKDLSRLGRDYIQTGQYTEVYFPAKKVRYIAVNDGFDSQSPYTDIAPFKHVVNEMYARDTSKKIRSSFATKMQEGRYIGNFAPYGYRKDPQDKNHLVPDETASAVVHKIYTLAAEGIKPADIAQHLNLQQILSPALYRCQLHPQLNPNNYTKYGQWSAATITKLLGNIVYLGHMAQGKTTKLSFKSSLTLRNPKESWIVVQNTHLPLVSVQLFFMAEKCRKNRTCIKKGRFFNLFSGLAKCADCGRNLSTVSTRRKGSPANLACGGYKLHGSMQCSNHFVDYTALYNIVLDALRQQLLLSSPQWAALYQELSAQIIADGNKQGHPSKLEQLQLEAQKLERIIQQLYDDKLNGKLAPARFYTLLQRYEEQSTALAQKCNAMGAPSISAQALQSSAQSQSLALLQLLLAHYNNLSQLTPHLLFALIDRIEVGQGWYEKTPEGRVKHQQIKIFFRFAETQS